MLSLTELVCGFQNSAMWDILKHALLVVGSWVYLVYIKDDGLQFEDSLYKNFQ